MLRHVAPLVLLISIIAAPAQAQSIVRTSIAGGYQEARRGQGASGTDLVFRQVFTAAETTSTDTLIIQTAHGRITKPINAIFTDATLERVFLRIDVVVYTYTQVERRLLDHGWQSWYGGERTELFRCRRTDLRSIGYRDAHGVELPLTPQFPE